MHLFLTALSLLPLYPIESFGSWSRNMYYPTEIYREGENSFCLLRSPVELSMNGVEYRLGFAFGWRNEISLSFSGSGPKPDGPISMIMGDGSDFSFSEHAVDRIGDVTVHRWTVSRPMMSKILSSLKEADIGYIEMPLGSARTMKFPIRLRERDISFEDARKCEDYRVGRVLAN